MTSSSFHVRSGFPRLTVILFLGLFVPALLTAAPAFCDGLEDSMKELASKKDKVTIEADTLQYDRKAQTYTATGSVRISQGDAILTAESASLNVETGEAEARGKAQIVTPTNVLFADTLKFNFDTKLGVIEKGNITVFKDNYHITGEKLERLGENEYFVLKGSLTSCDAVKPFWLVTADSLKVRMDKDVTGKGVVFRIKGVPVFYTPYAWFPLLKPRTSGFLIPGVGYSTKQGARIMTSYYWAPLDNFDTTLSLDFRSRRGLGISNEIRYALDKDSLTFFSGYYMDDRLENKARYKIMLRHQQVFSDAVSGRLDLNLSDDQFYRELTETTQERTQRSKDSNAFLTDNWGWGRAYFFTQYTQNLTPNPKNSNNTITQRLPEIGANILKKQVMDLPVYIDADVSGASFYKKVSLTNYIPDPSVDDPENMKAIIYTKRLSGERADGFIKASSYHNILGINISPRIGYRETGYNLHGDADLNLGENRGLFGAGIKMQTGLYRLFTFKGGPLEGIKHTVEPLIAYNYVIENGGRNLPKFDEVDTYGRRNQVAYSLANRFVFKFRENKRVDFMTLKLNQFYDLYGESAVTGKRPFSPLYGELVYEAGKNIKIYNNFRYDYYKGKILSINNDITYRDSLDRWHAGLGQRYSTNILRIFNTPAGREKSFFIDQLFMSPSHFDFFTPTTEFKSDFEVREEEDKDKVNLLTFEAGVKISSYWSASGKVWYDLHTNNFRETDVSVIYSSQCWSVTANYINRPGERQVMLLLNLKGLGNIRL